MLEHLTCGECGISFAWERTRPGGASPRRCSPCAKRRERAKQNEWRRDNAARRRATVNRQAAAWRDANPDKVARQRVAKLAARFNLSVEQIEALLADGRCGICGTAEAGGRWGRFAIDHDHACCPGQRSCGKCIRGVLCNPCNLLIGHMEKAGRLATEGAVAYLRWAGSVPKPEVLEDLMGNPHDLVSGLVCNEPPGVFAE